MEAAGFATGMRGAPTARQIGLDLQAAASGAGARRAISAASPRSGHLAFAATAASFSRFSAAFRDGRPPRRELAVMADAAARGAVPPASGWSGVRAFRSMVSPAAGGVPPAAAMRGLRRWSAAGRRFFCGPSNFQVAEGGAGLRRYVSMSADPAVLRGGHLPAPASSYAVYHGTCSPRGRRFRPRAQLGDGNNAPSENNKLNKGGRRVDEFMAAHPRSMAFLKLTGFALCTCVCYLSAKGDPRVKLLVETVKDAAEVYAVVAMVLIILKKLLFPSSGCKRENTSE